jgi:hypothetical protein
MLITTRNYYHMAESGCKISFVLSSVPMKATAVWDRAPGGHHGKNQLDTVGDANSRENPAQMAPYRRHAQAEGRGDLLVLHALEHQLNNLRLLRREAQNANDLAPIAAVEKRAVKRITFRNGDVW